MTCETPQWEKPQLAVPPRLVIGVTGHRKLENEAAVTGQVRQALERLRSMLPSLRATAINLTVLSPLAEGADRLVVREVLKLPSASLEAVLPLNEADYLHDFVTSGSRSEFLDLLSRAQRVKRIAPQPTREDAYLKAGQYVVDHCDALIAVWDGNRAAGRGGTGQVVAYARQRRCPLFWVHPLDPTKSAYKPGSGLYLRSFEDLDGYNAERLDSREIQKHTERERRRIMWYAADARFPVGNLSVTCDRLLPHYARADLLAIRFQRRYAWAGILVYALAAAAVAVVASQSLFLPKQAEIALLEAGLMAGVLATIWLGSRRKWHTKWIDYRFLAERLRSALFLAVAGVNANPLRPPRHLSLAYSPRDWMVAAFSAVWRQVPRSPEPDPAQFRGLRKFLIRAWLNDQINYHDKTSKRHGRRHSALHIAGYALFVLTLIAAMIHGIHGFLADSPPGTADASPGGRAQALVLMAIVLPAVGSALGAIQLHREHLRNAKRSDEMVRHLKEIRIQMGRTRDLEGFLPLVHETEETMLHELEDWRIIVRFRPVPAPG